MSNSNKYSVHLLFILFLLGCSDSVEEKVQAPYSIEKTAKIFADHIMADAAATNAIPITRDSLQALYYRQIFDMHQANVSDYQASLEFYSKEDSGMHKIFDQIDSLIKIEKK